MNSSNDEPFVTRAQSSVVDIADTQMGLPALVTAVEAGAEFVMSRAGVPVARLVSTHSRPQRRIGIDNGQIWIADDFDDCLELVKRED